MNNKKPKYKPFDDIPTWEELQDYIPDHKGRIFMMVYMFKGKMPHFLEVTKQYIYLIGNKHVDMDIECYLDSEGTLILGDLKNER